MLTRETFAARFPFRPLFGMIHLRALPGAPDFVSLDEVIERALADGRAIRDGGCHGFAVENFGDRPFTRGVVAAETVAAMARVIAEVAREVRLPFGVNVLRNDPQSALAIAAATGASFIRVNVHTGAMLTDQGIIEGDAYNTVRTRNRLAPEVLIFADHLVKHAVPVAAVDAMQAAKDLRLRGLADAVIVTGAETGGAADPDRFSALHRVIPDAPLLLGSGLSADNAHFFRDADGAIVGTAIKQNGDVDAPVDVARVEALVAAFRHAGS